jgi:hypothetical protein
MARRKSGGLRNLLRGLPSYEVGGYADRGYESESPADTGPSLSDVGINSDRAGSFSDFGPATSDGRTSNTDYGSNRDYGRGTDVSAGTSRGSSRSSDNDVGTTRGGSFSDFGPATDDGRTSNTDYGGMSDYGRDTGYGFADPGGGFMGYGASDFAGPSAAPSYSGDSTYAASDNYASGQQGSLGSAVGGGDYSSQSMSDGNFGFSGPEAGQGRSGPSFDNNVMSGSLQGTGDLAMGTSFGGQLSPAVPGVEAAIAAAAVASDRPQTPRQEDRDRDRDKVLSLGFDDQVPNPNAPLSYGITPQPGMGFAVKPEAPRLGYAEDEVPPATASFPATMKAPNFSLNPYDRASLARPDVRWANAIGLTENRRALARGDLAGFQAPIHNVANRAAVNYGRYGPSVEQQARARSQYSGVNVRGRETPGHIARALRENAGRTQQGYGIAKDILSGLTPDATKGAMSFRGYGMHGQMKRDGNAVNFGGNVFGNLNQRESVLAAKAREMAQQRSMVAQGLAPPEQPAAPSYDGSRVMEALNRSRRR